ncbi:MAG: hypothetical protein Kow0089_15620 [Desulfobulbaceae bacterium]
MFEEKAVDIAETVDARKEPRTADTAWEILRDAAEIVVGKGKKFVRFDPKTDSREEILAACLGRTGNLRAPALRVGNRFLVGFNDEMYREYLG